MPSSSPDPVGDPDLDHLPISPLQYSRRKTVSRRIALSGIALAAAGAAGGVYLAEPGRRAAFRRESGRWARRVRDRVEEEMGEIRDALANAPDPIPRTLESEREYSTFLATMPLRHITPREVIQPHRNVRDGVANELPPKEYWSRIKATLLVADEIRERLGKPLYCINSAYRSPAYNAACPGAATFSYHMENRALDLMFVGGSSAAYEVAKKLRDEKFFRGGIGVYDGFLHVDTRGRNATWDSRSGA